VSGTAGAAGAATAAAVAALVAVPEGREGLTMERAGREGAALTLEREEVGEVGECRGTGESQGAESESEIGRRCVCWAV